MEARHKLGHYLLDQGLGTYYHLGQKHEAVLDRVYVNLHVGWQQEWGTYCDVLNLPRSQAHQTFHLPVRFGISASTVNLTVDEVVQTWVTARPEWSKTVQEHLQELERLQERTGSAFLC